MLPDKVIIYDDSCPMCKLYTMWFVAWGFLKPENRIGFSAAPSNITSHVDLDRGRHEIPLFDRGTGETIYGLNALTHILESRWGWLRPVFKSNVFAWTFYPLYQIITYNRRVIAGCKHCCGFDCAPDLNRFYRAVYLGLAGSFIGMIACLLFASTTFGSTIAVGTLAAFGLVGTVCGTIRRLNSDSEEGWNYAGNFATTLLIISIFLTPLVVWPMVVGVAPPKGLAWFVVLVAALFGLEEIRRREL